jgi:hypothetical protein
MREAPAIGNSSYPQNEETMMHAASYRAHVPPENTTIVAKELFEDVRQFRAIGPAQLSSLLKNRQLRRTLQELDEGKRGLSEQTASTRL